MVGQALCDLLAAQDASVSMARSLPLLFLQFDNVMQNSYP